MEKKTKLDDRYTDGLYYDAMSGDFCAIQRGDEAVELVHPETATVYHEIDYDDWFGGDFYPVPEEAIEDPAQYLAEWASRKMSHSEMDVGLMFADVNTKIVETEDFDYIV